MNISEEISSMTREEIYNKLKEKPELLSLIREAVDAPTEAVQKATKMLKDTKRQQKPASWLRSERAEGINSVHYDNSSTKKGCTA